MKTFARLTLVATIVLVVAAQGTAAGLATTSVYTVGALTVPGVNTGLVLKKGHPVTVTATDTVCPGTGYCVGPDGNPAADTTHSSFGGFVLPGAPAYGLVGRVGTGPWVQVGSGPTTLSGKGVLVFAVNDDLFGDNTGSFTATVSYTGTGGGSKDCYPGWGYGDANHEHCGPPGLANKPASPGQSSAETHGSSNEHGSPAKGNSSNRGGS
jgi:hypothetical protein